jgi:hypothetical protein
MYTKPTFRRSLITNAHEHSESSLCHHTHGMPCCMCAKQRQAVLLTASRGGGRPASRPTASRAHPPPTLTTLTQPHTSWHGSHASCVRMCAAPSHNPSHFATQPLTQAVSGCATHPHTNLTQTSHTPLTHPDTTCVRLTQPLTPTRCILSGFVNSFTPSRCILPAQAPRA